MTRAPLKRRGAPLTKQQIAKLFRKKAGTRAGGWLFERTDGIDGNRNGCFKDRVSREDGLYPDRGGSGFPPLEGEAEAATPPAADHPKLIPGIDIDLDEVEAVGNA